MWLKPTKKKIFASGLFGLRACLDWLVWVGDFRISVFIFKIIFTH